MAQSSDIQTLVIDNGSGLIKAGYSEEDAPRTVFPNTYGQLKPQTMNISVSEYDYQSEDVFKKRGAQTLIQPVERCLPYNEKDLEAFWQRTFQNDIHANPEVHPVLLSETPMCPKENREKLAKIMFETMKVPSLFFQNEGVLSLNATGRTNGIVLGIGECSMYAIPIKEGFNLPHAIIRADIAGRDFTESLIKILNERRYVFKTAEEHQTLRSIKEKLCYVALDFQAEIKKSNQKLALVEKTYEMPDGRAITIGNQLFRCPETIFQPQLIGIDSLGAHEMIYQSIKKCGDGIKDELYKNVIIAGGSTMFNGISERLNKELSALEPTAKIKITAPPERKYQSWVGGSILASLSTFQYMLITKEEYNENGPSIVHYKCF